MRREWEMPDLTSNLQLEKPTVEEYYDVGVFNRNMDTIDQEFAKITDEETGVEAKLTKHLDETNTNAHKISNINGLQTALNNKIDSSLVNYTGLSLLNGIQGSVQIGVYKNGTRRLYIDFVRTSDIPVNTVVAVIPAIYR